MIRIVRIANTAQQGPRRAAGVYEYVARQPSWITRIALTAFLFVIALPILLLLMLAFLAAVMIFTILAIGNAALSALRGTLPRPDGRQNVRVIRHTDG